MTFKDMKPGIVYQVTKSSSDETFTVGDRICIASGNVILHSCGMWLDQIDYENDPTVTDFEVELDRDHYYWQSQTSESIKLIPKTSQELPWDKQLNEIAAQQLDVKFH